MKTAQSQPKRRRGTDGKAVAPERGAAAFFCSTVSLPMPDKAHFPAISPQSAQNAAEDNLLTETHYFCGGLAKHPSALVIRTEGQKSPLLFREVSA